MSSAALLRVTLEKSANGPMMIKVRAEQAKAPHLFGHLQDLASAGNLPRIHTSQNLPLEREVRVRFISFLPLTEFTWVR